MASRVQEGGGGMGSSGGFKARKIDKATRKELKGKIVYTMNADGSMSKPQTIKKNIKTIVKAKKTETRALINSTASKPPLATPKSAVKVVPKPTTFQNKLRNQALRSRFDYREPVKNQMIDIENSMARARNAGEIKPKVIKINSK